MKIEVSILESLSPLFVPIARMQLFNCYEKIRIREITNANRPIDSARPAPTYAYFDILFSASGFLEIPLKREEKTLPIAKADPRRPKAIKPIAINLSSM